VISVAANQVPGAIKAWVDAIFASDLEKAKMIHQKYYKLFTLNFVESNQVPGAIKAWVERFLPAIWKKPKPV